MSRQNILSFGFRCSAPPRKDDHPRGRRRAVASTRGACAIPSLWQRVADPGSYRAQGRGQQPRLQQRLSEFPVTHYRGLTVCGRGSGVGRPRGVGHGLGVALGVAAGVGVGVELAVGVGVAVGVIVAVGVEVAVGVGVDVGVGVGDPPGSLKA